MRQPRQKRASVRFPYKKPVQCINPDKIGSFPSKVSTSIESVDVSNEGMRIRLREWLPKVGAIIQIRIPVSKIKVTMPVLAQVKWVYRENHNVYHAGLQFLV